LSDSAVVVTSQNLAEFVANGGRMPEAKPETEKPAEAKADETKADTETPEGEESSQEKPKKKGVIEDLIETRRQRKEALKERDAIASQLAEARTQLDVLKKSAVVERVEEAPKRETFASDEDYIKALVDYQADRKLAERDAAAIKAEADRLQEEAEENWQTRLETVKEATDDYDDVVNACRIVFPRELLAEIKLMDNGPSAAYYLSHPDHADEAKKLVELFQRDLRLRRSPTAGLRAMGRLDAKLDKAEKATSKASPVTAPEVSKAPAPVSPLKGSSSSEKDPAKMTFEEYKAYRQKQSKR